MNIKNTKQGFTIIEVVLVLAIAGLIFLMVFVAFPALQRNQRDTQRRQDFANLSSQLKQAKTNGYDVAKSIGAINESDPSLLPSSVVYSTCNRNNSSSIGKLNAFLQGSGSDVKKMSCNFIRNYTVNTSTDTSTTSTDPNNFQDPDGETYSMYMSNKYPTNTSIVKLSSSSYNHYIAIAFNTKCNNDKEGKLESIVNPYAYTIRYRMESGDVYCQDGSL